MSWNNCHVTETAEPDNGSETAAGCSIGIPQSPTLLIRGVCSSISCDVALHPPPLPRYPNPLRTFKQHLVHRSTPKLQLREPHQPRRQPYYNVNLTTPPDHLPRQWLSARSLLKYRLRNFYFCVRCSTRSLVAKIPFTPIPPLTLLCFLTLTPARQSAFPLHLSV